MAKNKKISTTKTYKKEAHDSRPDIKEDHFIWEEVLKVAYKMGDVYGILHGLRCGGSRLSLDDRSLTFVFGTTFLPTDISRIKTKYIQPHKNEIKQVFYNVAYKLGG